MTKKIITWDLGATKCAAALVEYDEESKKLHCQKQVSIKIRECHSLEDLSKQLEKLLEIEAHRADAICIGAAGQYNGEYLHLDKGYPYPMEFSQLAHKKNWPNFAIIHDYSPIVCSTFTPYLHEPDYVKCLSPATLNPLGRRVALGVGTGIGMKDGILFENGDFWLGTNEVGHIGVTTPPLADQIYHQRHQELLHFLRRDGILSKSEPLTFEKLLANQGMALIHAFFDSNAKSKSSEEIGELVRDGKAEETLATFAWYLGLLIGTVQLAFMPCGGIWMTGGVLLNHLEIFNHKEFFIGIESSPAYLALRQQFPLGVLRNTEHAFIGAAYYASKRLL